MGKGNSNPLYVWTRPPFDYGQLEAEAASVAQAAVLKIRGLEKAASVDIGRELLAVKERLPHGQFLPWLEAEFAYTPRTANNLMQVASVFGDKYETVSHLPKTVQYALASPSTPDSVRNMVVSEIPPGRVSSPSIIKTAISKARKEAERETARKETAVERKAKQTKAEKRREAEDRRQDQRRERQEQVAAQAVQFLREQLGADLFAEFLGIVRETNSYALSSKLESETRSHDASLAA